MKDTDQYLATFERLEAQAPPPAWMSPLRKAGITRFAELGFPTLQQEDWRFTNVAPIASLPFNLVWRASDGGVKPECVAELPFGQLPAHRLVFVDGHYVAALSATAPLPPGVMVRSLAAALADPEGRAREHLAQTSPADDNAFAALNSAFFQDGGFIYVPAGCQVDLPVLLLFISTAKEAGASTQPRNLVLTEKGARVTVLESYVSLREASHFTNAVTEVALGEGATVEHVKFQDENRNAFHLATLNARLGRDGNFLSHSIALGARLSRYTLRTALAGEGVECVLNGLFLTRGDQLADHHMVVEHARPHCQSHEYYNGILDERSRGVFHGRILVRPAAQKTDAKQTNKNLLLSDDATVNSKPQLEIYADDVKCTHGATVGQLNEQAIFYLRSRGLDTDTARRMLIHAFAGEIIERIRLTPAREELDQLVWDRLEQNPRVGRHKCV